MSNTYYTLLVNSYRTESYILFKLIEKFRNGKIIVTNTNPEFDLETKSNILETLFAGIPIKPLIFKELIDGTYQTDYRLLQFLEEFYSDGFTYESSKCSTLPSAQIAYFESIKFSCIILPNSLSINQSLFFNY